MKRVIFLVAALSAGAPALAQNSSDRATPPAAATAAPKPAAKPKPAGETAAAAKPAAEPATTGAVKKKPAAGKPETEAKSEESAAAAATNSKANEAIRASYAAMPLAERLSIQSDLIWSKDYNGGVTGDFNDRSIAAVKAFQKRGKGKDTGIITPEERQALRAAVKEQQEQVGWRIVEDTATPGARLGIPAKLVPQSSKNANGSRWASARGEVQIETFLIGPPNSDLAAQFEKQKKNPAARRTEYSVLRQDFFVLSGLQGLKKFYVRAQIKGSEIRGVTILYDQAMEGIMEPVVVAMSSAFSPFDNAAAPTRRKVEYSTGILVSAAGHVIADRQATDGCHTVTVAGRGHAERVAEDAATDMALLRVYGANALKAASLSSEAPKGADLTLVGIADPQLQNGEGAVTTAPGRIAGVNGALVALEPVPAQGFSGAAALDAQGQFVGMIEMKPQAGTQAFQAALVPTATIRAFLEKAKVTPAVGRMTLDDAKAAVARVICVRK
jgi:peptidoglycan hydrolase-like protein with peptidoglycan-binding domain